MLHICFLGGTLKIYGESLCRDVPYKTLLLSIRDCAQAVVREMLAKYGLDKTDPLHYCLVQVSVVNCEMVFVFTLAIAIFVLMCICFWM